ncbi:Calx-beta domain-containing protein [Luteimonas sp. MJ204]|uniref:Calx-beta domain-containing protein n=1 Tax=Luteimonas sp. MJ145 TaxID=3129234 RepID=UPI0031BB2383
MHPTPRRLALALALSAAIGAAQADSTPQALPFAQDWTDTGLVTANDDWSNVPGILGYLGGDLTSANGVDPQTVLGADAAGVVDVIANQTNTSISNGGVAEFHIADPVVGLQGSGSADAPYLRIHLDTRGASGIQVSYRLRDVDASADDAAQQVALHYRVGGTGDFSNVPEAYVADASSPGGTRETPVSVTLPAEADNQALVELRIMTTNAAGNDEWIGIDDISVVAGGGGGVPVINVGNGSVAEGDSGTTEMFFQVGLSRPAGPGGASFDYATVDGTALAGEDYVAKSGTATIAEGDTSVSLSVTVTGDTVAEADETFGLALSNISGAADGTLVGTGTIVNDDFTIVPIAAIQGAGASSPLAGQSVVTEGIVTARKNNGFFMQTADGQDDGDDATSEGIFVFTAGAPSAAASIGHRVRVQATVEEYIPAADPYQLPMTELTFATVTQLGTGHALPAPVVLAADSVLPEGGLDQLEAFEGMRVSIPSATVVAPTRGNTSEANATSTGNGQFAVVVTGVPRPLREAGIQLPDPDPSGTTATAIPRWDFNPEVIAVDSDTIGAPQANLAAGCRIVDGTLTGPLDYTFRRYTIYPEGPLASACDGLDQPRGAVVPSEDHATFATYNLQRFFDTVNDPAISEPVLTADAFAARLNKASLGIRAYMHSPDVIGVSEVENLPTLQALADRINADAVALGEPDPGYVAYLEEGNDVGGIDVGFLVKSGEIAAGLQRVQVVALEQVGATDTWTYAGDGSTSRINDRPPLVLHAVVNFADGRVFPITVVTVHQRSLSGINDETPLGTGTNGDRVRQKRQIQAGFLANLLQELQTPLLDRKVVVLGDFNAFEFNDGYVDVMGALTGMASPDETTAVEYDGTNLVEPGFVNATHALDPSQRYSFVFENNAQSLDHILVNQRLLASPLFNSWTISHARLNADFPETARNDPDSAARLSDHDPSVLMLRMNALRFADMQAVVDAPQPAVQVGGTMTWVVQAKNQGPDAAGFPGVGFAVGTLLPTLTVEAPAGWTCDATTAEAGLTTSACTADTLAASATAGFTVHATAPAHLAGYSATLTAAATSQTDDPETSNDSDSATIAVAAQADLAVTMTAAERIVRGAWGHHSIQLHNNGPATVNDVLVRLSAGVDESLVWVDGSLECVTGSANPFRALCLLEGPFEAGQTRNLQFMTGTGSRLTPPRYDVTVQVESDIDDPDAGNNAARARIHTVRGD